MVDFWHHLLDTAYDPFHAHLQLAGRPPGGVGIMEFGDPLDTALDNFLGLNRNNSGGYRDKNL
jgi:hypothetical protein